METESSSYLYAGESDLEHVILLLYPIPLIMDPLVNGPIPERRYYTERLPPAVGDGPRAAVKQIHMCCIRSPPLIIFAGR